MRSWPWTVGLLLAGFVAGGYLVGDRLIGQTATPPGTTIPREMTSYRDVVKKVLPAVVSLEAKANNVAVKLKRKLPIDDPRLPEEFRRFFEEFNRFPDFNELPQVGFGSGFFIDPSGVILTNFHVVQGASSVTVTLHDGRKFTSRAIRTDPRTDLAIVILDAKGVTFPYLEFGDSAAAEIGDRVLAVGAPFGLTGSVTQGIVSAKGRAGFNMNFYEDFIQTDAAINPGNSGGPLVTLDGKVIGINAAIRSRTGGFQGVGLAIASNLAKNVAKQLQTEGVVRRGYLGVSTRDLDPEVAERLGVPKEVGVVVGQVLEGSPAARAGVQPGDIITGIGGKKIRDGKHLQETVVNMPINKETVVEVLRDGKNLQLPVTILEQPKDFGLVSRAPVRRPTTEPETVTLEKYGLEIADLTDDAAESFGFRPGTKGALISRVDPNSLAHEAGLRRGMVIVKVDDRKVANAAAAHQAFEAANLARGVLLQVLTSQGGINFVLLKAE
ncbi:MAG: Do family serine endopeptidase [Gemmataceae bacterium]|nr:Do family serine endopeptidase [Gemmataceae bacterium]